MADNNVGRTIQRLNNVIQQHGNKKILRQAVQDVCDEVNKDGIRKQLKFLIEQIGFDDTNRIVKELIGKDKEVIKLADLMYNSGQLYDIVCMLYDSGVKEYNNIATQGLYSQMRHLADKVGLDKLKKVLEARDNQ
jgi:hypothetical protein